jgi:rod shape determining protein RodA
VEDHPAGAHGRLFDQLVLYSAAGGSMSPWAFNQGMRFFVFLADGDRAVACAGELVGQRIAARLYGLIACADRVELLGQGRGGSQRWLDLGIIRLQPSELMKPMIVLALARFYECCRWARSASSAAIWPAAVLIGVPARW